MSLLTPCPHLSGFLIGGVNVTKPKLGHFAHEGPPRKYFTMLPNLYDDARLTVYEHRLLSHYCRRENCWESLRTTAKICVMSKSQVARARNSLVENGFIKMAKGEHGTYNITVIDKWVENSNIYHRAAPLRAFADE